MPNLNPDTSYLGRDMTNVLNTVKEMAYNEGLKEGMHLHAVEIARKMKSRGMDVSLISYIAGLSEKEIEFL